MAPTLPGGDQAASEGGADNAPVEMVDVRAKLRLEVESVPETAAKLRRLVDDAAGQVVTDDLQTQYGALSGRFEVRIPVGKAHAFLDAAGSLGRVLLRNVTATDVSKEYRDSGILLQNLQATLRRYEELLARATDVKDMLAIEAEMARVREGIDRVMGERRFLEDRVARATIHIELLPVRAAPFEEPRAKFHPGIKFNYFAGLGGGREQFLGTGASVQFGRRVSIDVDVLKQSGRGSLADGSDLTLLTIGGEAYSDFLGGGKRRYFNPYLGLRTGYGRVLQQGAFVLAATAGVELVRVKYFVLDAQAQGVGLIGPKDGPNFGVQTSLTARVAF